MDITTKNRGVNHKMRALNHNPFWDGSRAVSISKWALDRKVGLVTFSHLSGVCLSDYDFEMDWGLDPSQNLSVRPGAFCDGFLVEISHFMSGRGEVDAGWQLVLFATGWDWMTFCDGLRLDLSQNFSKDGILWRIETRSVAKSQPGHFATDWGWIRHKISARTFCDGLRLDPSQNLNHDILRRIEAGSVTKSQPRHFATDWGWIRHKISTMTFCDRSILDPSQNLNHDILRQIETGSVTIVQPWHFAADWEWIRQPMSSMTFSDWAKRPNFKLFLLGFARPERGYLTPQKGARTQARKQFKRVSARKPSHPASKFCDGLSLDPSQNLNHETLRQIETGSVTKSQPWHLATDWDSIRRQIETRSVAKL